MKTTLVLTVVLTLSGCSQGGSGQTVAKPSPQQQLKLDLKEVAEETSQQPKEIEAATSTAPSTAERRRAGDFGSAAAKAHPDQAKAMLAAAQKTWEASQASYEVGTTTLEQVHHWSKQLLFAERALAETKEQDLAALVDYWKRTKSIYLKVRALYNTGTRGGETEKFAAASFYLAEAEMWLLEAGGMIPESAD